MTGAVDLIAREGTGVLIVDYKTDRVAEADLGAIVTRDYGIQRLVYALAALRDGAPVVEVVHCFLERPDEPVSARFAAQDAGALEAELAQLAAGVLEERYPVAQAPHRELCLTCPGRAALCSWPEELTLRPAQQAVASVTS
jgi:hypothetical protein